MKLMEELSMLTVNIRVKLTQVTRAREQADQVDHSANEKKEGNYLIMC